MIAPDHIRHKMNQTVSNIVNVQLTWPKAWTSNKLTNEAITIIEHWKYR